jgi:hypothetical protein
MLQAVMIKPHSTGGAKPMSRMKSIFLASVLLAAIAPVASAQTPVWKQLVEQQLLKEQFCKVEYYVAEEISGEGADEVIKARVHCTDGRDFDIERRGENMKFRFEPCDKTYC